MKKITLYLLLLGLPILASPQSNYSLFFDETDGYISVDSNTVLETNGDPVTMVVWIKPLPLQPGDFSLIWCNRGAYLTFGATYYGFGLESNGAIHIKYSDGTNTVIYRTDSLVVSNGSWHNLIITIPSNHAYPDVSIDGVLHTVYKDFPQPAGTSDPINITNGDGFFISGNDYVLNLFNGWIYGLSIWNRVLTNYEMFCYSIELPIGTESGLSAFWDFHEGIGDTITDITNNAIQGKLIGTITWSSDIPMLDDCNMGEEENIGGQTLALFPNPAHDEIHIQSSGIMFEQIHIMDISGRLVRSFENSQKTPGNDATLNISDLSPGLYTLTVLTSQGYKKIKFIKD